MDTRTERGLGFTWQTGNKYTDSDSKYHRDYSSKVKCGNNDDLRILRCLTVSGLCAMSATKTAPQPPTPATPPHPGRPPGPRPPFFPKMDQHCNENPIYLFPEKELRGLRPNFHIHVSVSLLYIPSIGTYIFVQQNRQANRVIYKSLTGTWMWKFGLWPRKSFSGNICFDFSVLCMSLQWRICKKATIFCCRWHGSKFKPP